MTPFCACAEPRILTQPSGRVICEACGARLLEQAPKKERP
jgi:hypothetical protein